MLKPSVFRSLALCVSLAPLSISASTTRSSEPGLNSIINLSYGSFQGRNDSGGLSTFLGIPFAAPPLGKRRFGLPEPPIPFKGIHQAVSFGAACPQQDAPFPPQLPLSLPVPANQSEDCLFLNIFKPANISAGEKLPILFYIYGGGFAIGDASQYDGSTVVNRSIALGQPTIYVSANYRLNAFGFLGGKEVKEAGIGNAGLYDQIAALQWVQKHISKFGGDPKRVTLWGESAGAISIALQFLVNDGDVKGLFTGGIMQSGSPIPLPEVQFQQQFFDSLAVSTNCTTSADRLECLREVPYESLIGAINKTPNVAGFRGVNLAWSPMVDGKLIVRDPLVSLQQGKYAKVPFITGDDEDEGTIFSFSSLNITTDPQFLNYVTSNFLPNITDDQLKSLAAAYPKDPAQGSPFHTGTADALTPEFKRIAAFQGDLFFQASRRYFLKIASKTQPTYSFRYARGISLPQVGAFHGADLGEFFGRGNNTNFVGVDAVVYFANSGNPNAPQDSSSQLANITWDKWSSSTENPPLLTFVDPPTSVNITSDNFRQAPIQLLSELRLTKIGNPF